MTVAERQSVSTPVSDPTREILLQIAKVMDEIGDSFGKGKCKKRPPGNTEPIELLAGRQTRCQFSSQREVTKAKVNPDKKVTSKQMPDRLIDHAPEEIADFSQESCGCKAVKKPYHSHHCLS